MSADVDTFVGYLKSIWPEDFPALEECESEDAAYLEVYSPSGLTCGGFEFSDDHWTASVVSGSKVLYVQDLKRMLPGDFDNMLNQFRQAFSAPALHKIDPQDLMGALFSDLASKQVSLGSDFQSALYDNLDALYEA